MFRQVSKSLIIQTLKITIFLFFLSFFLNLMSSKFVVCRNRTGFNYKKKNCPQAMSCHIYGLTIYQLFWVYFFSVIVHYRLTVSSQSTWHAHIHTFYCRKKRKRETSNFYFNSVFPVMKGYCRREWNCASSKNKTWKYF